MRSSGRGRPHNSAERTFESRRYVIYYEFVVDRRFFAKHVTNVSVRVHLDGHLRGTKAETI